MENSESHPWPELIMRSFFAAGDEKPCYGPWNRLLNTLFPPDTSFEVVPQFPAVGPIDFFVLLLIYVNTTPVFIVEIRPPGDFHPSKREEADLQLRRCISDIITSTGMKIPVLHGVSAFGTKIAFYRCDKESRRLEPARIVLDPYVLMDPAPKERWHYDILHQEGADKFREVVREVKKMCEDVSS